MFFYWQKHNFMISFDKCIRKNKKRCCMGNIGKIKKDKISTGNNTVSKIFSYANDMDKSFFSYLEDLKKFDIQTGIDKDELIWEIDRVMSRFRELLFTFAPAVKAFLHTLGELIVKQNTDEIFMPSELQKFENVPSDFFSKWYDNINSHFNTLQYEYTSPEADHIRTILVRECTSFKVNYDHLEQYFNLISDYLTIWQEKDRSHTDYPGIINNLTNEQITFLAEKFLLPPTALVCHIQSLLAAKQELTMLRHEMLKNHLRLVISIARKFRNRGVSFNDIIQEGNLGLMRAIDKFDPNLGHKFSTYAVWWIKQNIIHGVASQSRTIRIPAHMLNLINKINRAEQKLLQTMGREPESEDIAVELGLPVAKVNAIRCMARQAISLQAPLGNQDDNFSLEDTLKDNSDSRDFTDFDKDVTYRTLYKLLSTLSRREQEIIVLRFGLFGHKPTPFTELSERFNLTRERVRQLELKIINKLRAPDKIKLLDFYFSNPKKQG